MACSMWAARMRAEQVTVLCAFRHGQGTIEAPNGPADYPPPTAQAISAPATQLKRMTPAPIVSAIGKRVPGAGERQHHAHRDHGPAGEIAAGDDALHAPLPA